MNGLATTLQVAHIFLQISVHLLFRLGRSLKLFCTKKVTPAFDIVGIIGLVYIEDIAKVDVVFVDVNVGIKSGVGFVSDLVFVYEPEVEFVLTVEI